MPRKWLHKRGVAAFWAAIILSVFAPSLVGAWLIPSNQLEALVEGARWGGPLWFGIVAGLVGMLRHRLHETLARAIEGDHWRVLESRHLGVEALQRRLDKMVGLSLILGLLSFFAAYAHSLATGFFADLIAASPFGAAGYVIWCFILWTRWRSKVDELSRDLAIAKRKKEQAREQLERLRQDGSDSSAQPPTVKTSRLVRPSPGKH